MMAQKPNIRSFRYSDEIACILNSYRGSNVSEKFENLVTDAFCMVEKRQQDLDRITVVNAVRRTVRGHSTDNPRTFRRPQGKSYTNAHDTRPQGSFSLAASVCQYRL